MAEKSESDKGAKTDAPKGKAKAGAKAEGKAGAKAEDTPDSAGASAKGHCQVAKCKQPLRAKGYCRKHYLAWRRGNLGKKFRYNTCSKEGCRKPAVAAGRCAEHKKGAAATPEAAAA